MKTTTRKRGNYIYVYEILRYEYSPQLRHSIAILGKQVDKRLAGKSIVNGMCRFCRREAAIAEYHKDDRRIIALQKQGRVLDHRTKLNLDFGIDNEAFVNYLSAIGTAAELESLTKFREENRQNLAIINENLNSELEELENQKNETKITV